MIFFKGQDQDINTGCLKKQINIIKETLCLPPSFSPNLPLLSHSNDIILLQIFFIPLQKNLFMAQSQHKLDFLRLIYETWKLIVPLRPDHRAQPEQTAPTPQRAPGECCVHY